MDQTIETTPEQQAPTTNPTVAVTSETDNAAPINPYMDRILVPTTPGRPRAIVLYPDDRLTKVSKPVEFFGGGIERLAADMLATCEATGAAGLSAVQLGVATRLILVRVGSVAPAAGYVAMANPVISFDGGMPPRKVVVTEGCLSFPRAMEKVERFLDIVVHYDDLQGEPRQMHLTVDSEATGVAAQAVQHEVEHLDGVLLLSHLNIVRRDSVRQKMKQVGRLTAKVCGKTRGLTPTQAIFGYVPEEYDFRPPADAMFGYGPEKHDRQAEAV